MFQHLIQYKPQAVRIYTNTYNLSEPSFLLEGNPNTLLELKTFLYLWITSYCGNKKSSANMTSLVLTSALRGEAGRNCYPPGRGESGGPGSGQTETPEPQSKDSRVTHLHMCWMWLGVRKQAPCFNIRSDSRGKNNTILKQKKKSVYLV